MSSEDITSKPTVVAEHADLTIHCEVLHEGQIGQRRWCLFVGARVNAGPNITQWKDGLKGMI